ncbi:hypothetical protein DRQ09_05970 [candidate division KSB1 bacterium]|nr:MAG: hypothetical protein DRQ09_05970 [candidate division KSB1 bacterium]
MINIKRAIIDSKIEKLVKEYRKLKLELEEYKSELNILKQDPQVKKYIELTNIIDETPKKLVEISNEIAALQYQKEDLIKAK